MKYLMFVILSATACLADPHTNWIARVDIMNTNMSASSASIVSQMRSSGSLTNVVKQLMAEGEVCKIAGHAWRGGRPSEGPAFRYADYRYEEFRTCTICGTCQRQSPSAWK